MTPIPALTKATSLNLIIDELAKHFKPERIYLFGSQARGEASVHSDYDLFIVMTHLNDKKYRLAQQAHLLLAQLKFVLPIDIHFATVEEFNELKTVIGSLPHAVEEEGKVLYAA